MFLRIESVNNKKPMPPFAFVLSIYGFCNYYHRIWLMSFLSSQVNSGRFIISGNIFIVPGLTFLESIYHQTYQLVKIQQIATLRSYSFRSAQFETMWFPSTLELFGWWSMALPFSEMYIYITASKSEYWKDFILNWVFWSLWQ